jgi:hypothetical protein
MVRWKKETLEPRADHRWRAASGYQICVMGRGAVRFDFPQTWVMEPDTVSFKFYDRVPPDDDIRLEASYNWIPPVNWSRFLLAQLLDSIVTDDYRGLDATGEIESVERDGLRLVWRETSFEDPVENREARSRISIGLGTSVQCLITMEYWPEDAHRAIPVWDEVIRTLELERCVGDPRLGDGQEPHRG